MSRAARTWPLLVLLGLFAVLGLWWLSTTALRLERAQAEARATAQLEERVRLSLWRMDGFLARRVATESARVPQAWQPLWEPEALDGAAAAGARLPSELLRGAPRGVLLHLELDGDGAVRSPQVPEGRDLALLTRVGQVPAGARSYAGRLQALRAELEPAERTRLWRAAESSPLRVAQRPAEWTEQRKDSPQSQTSRSLVEFGKRSGQYVQNAMPQQAQLPRQKDARSAEAAAFAPVWLGQKLFLARRAVVDGEERLQAVWLDWAILEEELLREVEDLLPAAELVAVTGAADVGGDLLARQLASVPARLVPGALPDPPAAAGTVPLWPVLAAAWSAVLLAFVALGVLLAGATALSERRAAFVSAVTHELRTPLTTFRMYSEMLASGMVTEDAQRQSYLETLQREADRLGRLVENVLAYAKLERRRAPRAAEVSELGALLDRHSERLHARAAEAGMALEVRLDPAARAWRVRADGDALEQVLFNLVDNACKYGKGTLHLFAERRGATVALVVADEGPGVPPQMARRLFEPFSRAAEEAAGAAPGVGLGLALCRRLMRAMGGDLRYEGSHAGARFAALLRAG